MSRTKDKISLKNDLIVQHLKKNNNFFIDHPELISLLNFPNKIGDLNKIVDINAYRSKKIKVDYDQLKIQMTEILKAGSNHISTQKRILKTSLKILNAKSFIKLMELMVNDMSALLMCDIVNYFATNNFIRHNKIKSIDKKIVENYFPKKFKTNLNQNPKGIDIFFSNKIRTIKSYMLVKINCKDDFLILAIGSKKINKFSKEQQIDLIEYLAKVIEIKLTSFI